MIGDFLGDFIFLFLGACFYGLCWLLVLVAIYLTWEMCGRIIAIIAIHFLARRSKKLPFLKG